MEDSMYYNLIEFSKIYSNTLKDLNLQTINLMKSEDFFHVFKAFQLTTKDIIPRIEIPIFEVTKYISTTPKLDILTQQIIQPLKEIAEKYKNLFSSYTFSALSDATKIALEKSQLTSIMQLALSHQTEMIHDAISCFANAKYEYLPSVFNAAMKKPIIGAADVAFLKAGSIIPIIKSELDFPKGIKSSLKQLNHSSANDIADNDDINYDTTTHKFITSSTAEDSTSMNIILAGKAILDPDGDMFTEVELMDFVSFLSQTPMLGMAQKVGKKIYSWLKTLFEKKTNLIDFDREIYFHSRSREKDSMPYTYEQMLSAPHGCPGAGRFNQVGRSHFYFASTQEGAETEIQKHLKNDQIIQTVKINPIHPIQMLDLSNTVQRGKTFLRMIRFPLDDDNKMPRQYLLPCFVADCCQMIGYDGIKYYGSKVYDNYVSWSDHYFKFVGMCS